MSKFHPKGIGTLGIFFLIVIIGSLAAACSPQIQTQGLETEVASTLQEIEPTSTQTPRATRTPTQTPLGSPDNPITMGFILKPEETAAIEAAEDVAFLFSDLTGYQVESLFYPDFSSYAVTAQNNEIHLLWLNPIQYLYLNGQDAADAIVMTNHLGVYAYGVQFLANVQRGFTVYYDPQTNESTGTPVQALQQFAGTRPCFINDESIPGYYVPLGLLANASTPTLEPIFTYGYSPIVRALYIQGLCDFGAAYALTGDARSASDVIQELPDVMERVIVIWQSEGIIPNIGLSANPGLPENITFQLEEGILNISDSPEGLSLLSTALNYEVEALKGISDSFYNPLREAIAPLELNLAVITQP